MRLGAQRGRSETPTPTAPSSAAPRAPGSRCARPESGPTPCAATPTGPPARTAGGATTPGRSHAAACSPAAGTAASGSHPRSDPPTTLTPHAVPRRPPGTSGGDSLPSSSLALKRPKFVTPPEAIGIAAAYRRLAEVAHRLADQEY